MPHEKNPLQMRDLTYASPMKTKPKSIAVRGETHAEEERRRRSEFHWKRDRDLINVIRQGGNLAVAGGHGSQTSFF